MGLKTQGTELYFLDPSAIEVIRVGCVLGISGLGSSVQARDVTPVESDVEISEPGMFSPGQTDFSINLDPQSHAHLTLKNLYMEREIVQFAVGLSDGLVYPEVGSGGVLAETPYRSFIFFDGWISGDPSEIALNAFVTLDFSVVHTTVPSLSQKVADATYRVTEDGRYRVLEA